MFNNFIQTKRIFYDNFERTYDFNLQIFTAVTVTEKMGKEKKERLVEGKVFAKLTGKYGISSKLYCIDPNNLP